MLKHYLSESLRNLDELINLTKNDIASIKDARHSELFSNTTQKESFINGFESSKRAIDNELRRLVSQGMELGSVLDDNDQEQLELLKIKLKELKDLNRRLAKMVVAVSEFYNSLLTRLLPQDKQMSVGYNNSATAKAASLLTVRG